MNPGADLGQIEDLPLFEGMQSADWGVDFDVSSEELFARKDRGILRDPGGSVLAYTNEDLRVLAKMPDLANLPFDQLTEELTSEAGDGPRGYQQLMRNHVFTLQPPTHGPVRQVFSGHLAKGKVQVQRGVAEDVVESVLDDVPAGEVIDFENDFARVVSARFWSRFLEISIDESDQAAQLAGRILPALNVRRSAEEALAANRAAAGYMEVLSRGIDRVVAGGGNESFNEMAFALEQVEDPDRPASVGLAFASMLFDAFHTATALTTNVVYTLLQQPAIVHEIIASPDVIGTAVSEAMRLNSPIIATVRCAFTDIEHRGVTIRRGTPVKMLWIFGNRDPEVFASPAEFRLDRERRRQVTFGGGFHICPGRNIASVLVEAMVSVLFRDDVEIDVSGDARWLPASKSHQLESLPVTIHRR
ncbi:MAG: cytochrome P450 [Solirubrobacterales bacterium]